MTIEEIKSVSIYQWMKENNYGDGVRKGKSIFYYSPLRPENSPSFAVNIKENLWYDLEAALAVISSTLLNVCILHGLNIKFFHFFKGKLKKRNCYTVKIITLC